MEQFFSKRRRKKLSGTERLFQQDLPLFMLEIVRNYFRLDMEGIEHIPKKGKALIVPNHSGVTALDAVMIGHEIFRALDRIPKVLAHPLWFVGPHIRVLVKRMGMVEANKDAGEKMLNRKKLVMIFPEGEAGNFKPTADRYKLRHFHRGFVRMAMATQSPIVPVVVIGAEETNINLSQISLTKYLRGVVIPIPLNVLPLPAKWKIIFMPPVDMSKYSKEDAADRNLVKKISEEIKELMQARIDRELSERKWIYFPKGSRKQYLSKKSSGKKAQKNVDKKTAKSVTRKKKQKVSKALKKNKASIARSKARKTVRKSKKKL